MRMQVLLLTYLAAHIFNNAFSTVLIIVLACLCMCRLMAMMALSIDQPVEHQLAREHVLGELLSIFHQEAPTAEEAVLCIPMGCQVDLVLRAAAKKQWDAAVVDLACFATPAHSPQRLAMDTYVQFVHNKRHAGTNRVRAWSMCLTCKPSCA
jgi:hypothetical protein